jgi:hypothetical protein
MVLVILVLLDRYVLLARLFLKPLFTSLFFSGSATTLVLLFH